MATSRIRAAAFGAVTALAAERVLRSRPMSQWGPARLARLSGTTIAHPSAAGWITDFLNASYYAKAPVDRDLEELRLAFAVLTTRWNALGGRRLSAVDVAAFHASYFGARWSTADSPRGMLTREQLLTGAETLLGSWFPEAVADPARRGWGIAFPTPEDKAAHDPTRRLEQAPIGPLTPPSDRADAPTGHGRGARGGQVWHTYPPVEVPSAERAAEALLAVETWPDYASELGRFTPLRPGGLEGQTFEIEVVAFPTSRTPVLLRAYVTATTVVSGADPAALDHYITEVNEGFARHAPSEPRPVPPGADVVAAFDLTCHEGHFMGRAKNRLFLFTVDGRAYLRAAGTWDAMEWPLAQVYDRAGRYAQHAFWGMESPRESMLHQIAAAKPRQTGA